MKRTRGDILRYPFDKFKLGTCFGQKGTLWRCGYHSGQDFMSAGYGGDGLVYPIYVGKVLKIGRSGSYGNCVYIKHSDGYISLYAHLKTVYVKAGMAVTEQTVLGVEGATGNVTGRHLHMEVHKGAYNYPATIDPLEFIKQGLEDMEVEKQLRICLNGVEKDVKAIEKDGNNYVRLQDLRDDKLLVGYNAAAQLPVICVRSEA